MLKKNVFANYIGQIYMVLVGIALMPIYIKYMGAEAYGIVGFYVVLQVWFQLFDFGLTPTMSRQVSKYRANSLSSNELNKLLRALELLFLSLSLIGIILVFKLADFIATSWLHFSNLNVGQVKISIILMFLIISIRWIGGLYRGVIIGFEELVWLNIFNVFVSTLKFLLVIPFFILISTEITKFFALQFAVALIEICILKMKVLQLMPKKSQSESTVSAIGSLKSVFKFSFAVAFADFLLAFVMQFDKIILSKKLILSDYGYYSLATLLASGIISLSSPILGAMQPRFSKIAIEQKNIELLALYSKSTQFIMVVAFSTSLLIATFSYQILIAWTGSEVIAQKLSGVVSFCVLGNGILAIRNLGTSLQFAYGSLKLYIFECLSFLLIFIPTLLFLIDRFGMIGAAYAWLLVQLLFFIFWMPLVHNKFLRFRHVDWLLHDLMPIVIASASLLTFEYFSMSKFSLWPSNRFLLACVLCIFGGSNLVVCTLFSEKLKPVFLKDVEAFLLRIPKV